MTNVLLAIITALLFARIALQVRQGKQAVENALVFCENNNVDYVEIIKGYNKCGYELVQMLPNITADGKSGSLLLFTRKKIKITRLKIK